MASQVGRKFQFVPCSHTDCRYKTHEASQLKRHCLTNHSTQQTEDGLTM